MTRTINEQELRKAKEALDQIVAGFRSRARVYKDVPIKEFEEYQAELEEAYDRIQPYLSVPATKETKTGNKTTAKKAKGGQSV